MYPLKIVTIVAFIPISKRINSFLFGIYKLILMFLPIGTT